MKKAVRGWSAWNDIVKRAAKEGKCANCCGPRDGRRKFCEACREARKCWLAKRIAEGLCWICGHPNGTPFKVCRACLDKRNAARREKATKRKARGYCPLCDGPRDAPLMIECSTCRRKEKLSRDRLLELRREKGLCHKCGDRAVTRGKRPTCDVCWFKERATATGVRYDWAMLKRIFDRQGRRCAYTGTPLVLGDNASLDHKVPRSAGGPHAEENLQWVCKRVNSMKGDLPSEDFIAFCRAVAAHCPEFTS